MKKLLKRFRTFINKRLEKREKQRQKTKELISGYEKLIADYYLIQEGKSTLSRKKREAVIFRINYLISIGHIKGVKL